MEKDSERQLEFQMIHKITIEIDNDLEWDALCALSSLLSKPLSELAKEDVIYMTKYTAEQVKNDSELMVVMDDMQPENKKRLLKILN